MKKKEYKPTKKNKELLKKYITKKTSHGK